MRKASIIIQITLRACLIKISVRLCSTIEEVEYKMNKEVVEEEIRIRGVSVVSRKGINNQVNKE